MGGIESESVVCCLQEEVERKLSRMVLDKSLNGQFWNIHVHVCVASVCVVVRYSFVLSVWELVCVDVCVCACACMCVCRAYLCVGIFKLSLSIFISSTCC